MSYYEQSNEFTLEERHFYNIAGILLIVSGIALAFVTTWLMSGAHP